MTAAVENDPNDPLYDVTLWPHRSLSPRGFRLVMLVAAVGVCIPLIPIVGTNAAWVIAGFLLFDLALLYGMLQLTYRSGRVREHVRIWPDRVQVERIEPNGRRREWSANPQWVRVELVDTKRIEKYLILASSGREIELGAFLTPGERSDLAREIRQALANAASHPMPQGSQ
ncbi:MAG: DUF2244 domain-containing protein [Pseudomonadota bacterium]